MTSWKIKGALTLISNKLVKSLLKPFSVIRRPWWRRFLYLPSDSWKNLWGFWTWLGKRVGFFWIWLWCLPRVAGWGCREWSSSFFAPKGLSEMKEDETVSIMNDQREVLLWIPQGRLSGFLHCVFCGLPRVVLELLGTRGSCLQRRKKSFDSYLAKMTNIFEEIECLNWNDFLDRLKRRSKCKSQNPIKFELLSPALFLLLRLKAV